jgi:hypothetical protein
VIRIGATVLALDEPVAAALAELEDAEDEPVPLGDAPPPPSTQRAAPERDPSAGSSTPEGDGAASVKPASAAPVADARADTTMRLPKARRRRWSGTDFAVVAAALGVIALSAAGLYWLLRP